MAKNNLALDDGFEEIKDAASVALDDGFEESPIEEKPYTMPSEVEAFGKSAANSALLNYLPQVQGAVAAATGGDYLKERDQAIDDLAKLRAENPKSALAGDVLGVVGPSVLTGGLGAAAKGATLAAKVGSGVKTGAALGAVANPGDVKGEMGAQLSERATGGLLGGLVGGTATLAAEKIPSVSKKVSEYLKDKSNRSAYQALGARKRFVSQNLAKDNIDEIGETLLDKGIITKAPRSLDKLAERIKEQTQASGQDLDNMITKLAEKEDKLFGKAKPSDNALAIPGQKQARGGIDKGAISNAIKEDLIQDLPLESIQKQNGKILEMIDDFNQGGPMSLKEANDFKIKLGKQIKWDRLPNADIPLEEQFYRSLYSKLRQGTEDSAEFLAGESGDLANYIKAKKDYGNLKNAELILKDKMAAQEANRLISPSDYFTGGLGSAVGYATGDSPEEKARNALIGLGVGGVNKMARKYGPQVAAKTQRELSKLAEKAGMKASEYKSAFPGVAERIREKFAYDVKEKKQ